MSLHNTPPSRVDREDTQETVKESSTYVETVREGAVGAGIFRGQSNHFFVLSRAWKSSKTDASGYSSGFFPGNAEAIGNVVKLAVERCRRLDKASASASEGEVSLNASLPSPGQG